MNNHDDTVHKKVYSNLEESKRARNAHNEGKGLSYEENKFNSHNFTKLSQQRGYTKQQEQEVKTSFNRWAGENRNPNESQKVTAKHSPPEGDKGHVYGNSSGRYVATEEYKTSSEAKEKLATPPSNKMDTRQEVRVHGDQIRGTVAPQRQWTAEAKNTGDGIERKGGGTQIYTNGGFKSGAVKSHGPEQKMQESPTTKKQDSFGIDMSKAEKSHSSNHNYGKSK